MFCCVHGHPRISIMPITECLHCWLVHSSNIRHTLTLAHTYTQLTYKHTHTHTQKQSHTHRHKDIIHHERAFCSNFGNEYSMYISPQVHNYLLWPLLHLFLKGLCQNRENLMLECLISHLSTEVIVTTVTRPISLDISSELKKILQKYILLLR